MLDSLAVSHYYGVTPATMGLGCLGELMNQTTLADGRIPVINQPPPNPKTLLAERAKPSSTTVFKVSDLAFGQFCFSFNQARPISETLRAGATLVAGEGPAVKYDGV